MSRNSLVRERLAAVLSDSLFILSITIGITFFTMAASKFKPLVLGVLGRLTPAPSDRIHGPVEGSQAGGLAEEQKQDKSL